MFGRARTPAELQARRLRNRARNVAALYALLGVVVAVAIGLMVLLTWFSDSKDAGVVFLLFVPLGGSLAGYRIGRARTRAWRREAESLEGRP